MFDYQKYLKISRDRMINALLVSDYGTLTEKLMRWKNKGFNNKIWEEAPSITAGSNNKSIDMQILDGVPYAIGIRDDSHELIEKLLDENKAKEKNGGKELNYEKKSPQELLALLTIPIQFSILEYFEFQSIEKILHDACVFLIDTDKFSLKDLNDNCIYAHADNTNKYTGIYSFYHKSNSRYGKIVIKNIKEDIYSLKMDLSRGAPSYNMGKLRGEIKIKNNEGFFYRQSKLHKNKACEWKVIFDQNKLIIKILNSNTDYGFGYGVYVDGKYNKFEERYIHKGFLNG